MPINEIIHHINQDIDKRKDELSLDKPGSEKSNYLRRDIEYWRSEEAYYRARLRNEEQNVLHGNIFYGTGNT